MPSTLAPDRLGVSSRRVPSRGARPPGKGEVTLSQELRTAGLLRPHVLVGSGGHTSGCVLVVSPVTTDTSVVSCHSPHRSGLAHHAHPVPQLMNSRPARSVVGTWTWFRSRCTCQVSLQRLMRRHPLLLTGFLGLVPRFNGTMRCCDSLPPISPRFVSFAGRYHRYVRGSSPPAPDAEPWINRELVGGISSRLARWKRQGLPSSRRNLCDHSPYSSDPGVTRQAEWTMG